MTLPPQSPSALRTVSGVLWHLIALAAILASVFVAAALGLQAAEALTRPSAGGLHSGLLSFLSPADDPAAQLRLVGYAKPAGGAALILASIEDLVQSLPSLLEYARGPSLATLTRLEESADVTAPQG